MKINKTYRKELMVCEFIARVINKIPESILAILGSVATFAAILAY